MHNLLRFFRQNRKKIIRGAIFIAFLFIILQILNYISSNTNTQSISNNDIFKESNGTIISSKSAVSGSDVSEREITEVRDVIKEFVELCNNKNIEEAYNLISDSCKQELYSDVESFANNYYQQLFNGETRNYTVQNWSGDTYMVKFTQDLLATGKSGGEVGYTDYITVVTENKEKKLNLNSFIGKEEINKETKENNIKIKVLNRVKYMEYETYEIEVTNDNNDIIELAQPTPDKKSIYLKDSKDTRHYAYSNEIIDDEMKIQSKYTKKVKIKFDNPYISDRRIKKMCFSKVVLYMMDGDYRSARLLNMSVNI